MAKQILLRIECGALVFKTKLDTTGVAIITKETAKTAEKISRQVGRVIINVEGNFDTTTFFLDQELTEDQVEKLVEEYL